MKFTKYFRIYFTKNFSSRQAPSGVEGVCTYEVFLQSALSDDKVPSGFQRMLLT